MPDSQFLCPIGTYGPQCGPLLQTVWSERRRFMYVKFIDAVTYVVGHVCQMGTTLGFVTNDVDGTIVGGTGLRFAGVVPNAGVNGVAVTAVPAQNDFGYIQVEGPHTAIVTNGDDDIAIGDTLIMASATDGAVDSVVNATGTGTLLYVGIAFNADVDAANTVYGIVKSLLW